MGLRSFKARSIRALWLSFSAPEIPSCTSGRYLARYLPEVQEGISGAEKESQSARMDRALNDRRPIARGKLMYSGYYTVPFDEKILLDARCV